MKPEPRIIGVAECAQPKQRRLTPEEVEELKDFLNNDEDE